MKKAFTAFCTLLLPLFMLANFGNPAALNAAKKLTKFSKFDSTMVVHSDCPMLKRKCSGQIKWADGTHYKGDFRFGKPHGEGTITYTDGTFYKGEFKNGFTHGKGLMEYDDGSFYEGEWSYGFKEGQGTYTFAEGHEYSGAFVDDVMNGFGKIKLLSGEIYEGEWSNGLADGKGTFTRKDGSQFIGLSKDGQRDGEGQIVYPSGDVMTGIWENGLLVEEATYTFSDGTSMVSFWEDGELQDQLTYIDILGNELIGSLEILSQNEIVGADDFLDKAGDKMPLVFYGFAMEFHAMQNYDLAERHLDLAYLIDSPAHQTPYRDMVVELTANIHSERVNRLLGRGSLLFRF